MIENSLRSFNWLR